MTDAPMLDGDDSLPCEIHALVQACLASTATPAQRLRLERLVCEDLEARRLYVHYMHDSLLLRRWATASSGQVGREVAAMETSAPDAPFPSFLGSAIHGTVGYVSSGWPVAYLTATVILGIALWIASLVHVSEPAQVARQNLPSPSGRGAGGEGSGSRRSSLPSIVGRITGMVDCRWEEGSGFRVQGSGLPSPAGRGAGGEGDSNGLQPSSFIPHPSSLVSLGDTFALASGLLEITYDTGAKVILQGPVTYEVESKDSGFLSVGKLTARVESAKPQTAQSKTQDPRPKSDGIHPSSLIPHPLFAVRTPSAVVTDLGTEFGVEVSSQGYTTSRVFRGAVTLQVTSVDGKAEGVARVLHENESARVASRGNDRRLVAVSSAQPVQFVREIPKRTIKTLDLVDVVAGGDGFSGRRGRGIDATGQLTDHGPKDEERHRAVVGDGKYHRAVGLPFVDGVFIPDGRAGPVQVDSAGHTFADCPATCNKTGGPIWAGGPIPVPKPDVIPTELSGIDYASPGHGLLFLHANKGMTFDLDAIRRANPGNKLLRFRAVTGNTENESDQGLLRTADVWVLVDGEVRFRRREINGYNGGFSVAFPIHQNDRFLTLVATDGGNGHEADWILFGDPRLELLPVENGPNR